MLVLKINLVNNRAVYINPAQIRRFDTSPGELVIYLGDHTVTLEGPTAEDVLVTLYQFVPPIDCAETAKAVKLNDSSAPRHARIVKIIS